MTRLTFLALAGLLAAAAPPARADILFLDINHSKNEVAAAERAAKERGEKLQVISGGPDFQAEVRRYLAGDPDISSLVVSGHYNGKHYYDDEHSVALRPDDLVGLFAGHPKTLAGIEHVLLWGCYTNRPKALAFWQKKFTGQKMIAGFNWAGPPDRSEAGPELLRQLLVQAPALSLEQDAARTEQWLRDLQTFPNTAAAVALGGCYITAQNGSVAVEGLGDCPEAIQAYLKERVLAAVYARYESGRQPIPEDTGKGPLRRAFIDVDRYRKDCAGAEGLELPSSAAMLGLLHFNDLRRGFAAEHGALLKKARQALEAAEGEEKAPVPWPELGADGTSRADVLAFAERLREAAHRPKAPKALVELEGKVRARLVEFTDLKVAWIREKAP